MRPVLSSASCALVVCFALSVDLLGAQQVVVPTILLGPVTGRLVDGFTGMRAVRELADGTVLVATSQERTAPWLADFTSRTAEEIGPIGDGPGDFRNAHGIHALANDSTLVEDGGRWSVLKGRKFASTVKTWVVGWTAPIVVGADTSGNILEVRPSRYGTPARTDQFHLFAESLVVVLHRRSRVGSADPTTGRADTIARLRGPFRDVRRLQRPMPGRDGKPVPGLGGTWWQLHSQLVAEEQALLFRDGWIALVYGDPYRVDWRAPDGKRITGQRLPFDTVLVTQEDKLAAVARRRPRSPTLFRPDEYPPWPRILPAFVSRSLVAMPDGRVAIARTPDIRKRVTTYDIVDRTGRLTLRLQLPENERLVGFGIGTVYVARRDRDDLLWLERHAWPPAR